MYDTCTLKGSKKHQGGHIPFWGTILWLWGLNPHNIRFFMSPKGPALLVLALVLSHAAFALAGVTAIGLGLVTLQMFGVFEMDPPPLMDQFLWNLWLFYGFSIV